MFNLRLQCSYLKIQQTSKYSTRNVTNLALNMMNNIKVYSTTIMHTLPIYQPTCTSFGHFLVYWITNTTAALFMIVWDRGDRPRSGVWGRRSGFSVVNPKRLNWERKKEVIHQREREREPKTSFQVWKRVVVLVFIWFHSQGLHRSMWVVLTSPCESSWYNRE